MLPKCVKCQRTFSPAYGHVEDLVNNEGICDPCDKQIEVTITDGVAIEAINEKAILAARYGTASRVAARKNQKRSERKALTVTQARTELDCKRKLSNSFRHARDYHAAFAIAEANLQDNGVRVDLKELPTFYQPYVSTPAVDTIEALGNMRVIYLRSDRADGLRHFRISSTAD